MAAKKNSVRTTAKIAKKAAKVLSSSKATKEEKQIAGSALSNRKKNNKN